MPLIFSFHLFIGSTAKAPHQHNDSVSTKRSKALSHCADRDVATGIYDRDFVPKPNRRTRVQEVLGPYERECEGDGDFEEARRRDRESLAILLHDFPSPLAKEEEVSASVPAASPPGVSNSGVVSGAPPARFCSSPLHHQPARSSTASTKQDDESDWSHLSVSQRFPFRGQISGLLLRSILDGVVPRPVHGTPESHRAVVRTPVEGGREQDDSIQDLFEQLRRKDLAEENMGGLACEDSRSSSEIGGGDGRATGDGVEGIAGPSSVDGRDDGVVVVSTSTMLGPDSHGREQRLTEAEAETEITDSGEVLHQSIVGATPIDEPDSDHSSSCRPVPEPSADAHRTAPEAADRPSVASAPSTICPHYALPTAVFRSRNRRSYPPGHISSPSAPTAAKRAGSLLPTARSQSQSLKMHSKLASGLGSSVTAQTRDLDLAAPGVGTVPVPVEGGGRRITSAPPPHRTTNSLSVAQVHAGRSSSWNPNTADFGLVSRFPGLSASLTPVIIRGGGKRASSRLVAALPEEEKAVSTASLSADVLTAETSSSSDVVGLPGMDARDSEDECRRFEIPSHQASANGQQDEQEHLIKRSWSPLSQNRNLPPQTSRLSTPPAMTKRASPARDVFVTNATLDVVTAVSLTSAREDENESSSSSAGLEAESRSDAGPTDQCIRFEVAAGDGDGGDDVVVEGEQAAADEAAHEGDEGWDVVCAGEREGEEDGTSPFDIMSPAPKTTAAWREILKSWR
ncbi:hypothetical protein EJ03DRAFT_371316 [Teratosphaeria nubilosa]|uniref:Uncharacterized protein n=1 Tax=Teratosphaeria nubilosa TaxID=161662 RepID=A0A6G1LKK6_9PEZI|nr:hypothetical protein EJ03DRAFT_371316 [Teratosphaeria nubilosa]